jgi:hypothetical protein
MMDDRQDRSQADDVRAVVRAIFEAVAGEDAETVRAVLRENAALADAVLGREELRAMMRALVGEASHADIEELLQPVAERVGAGPHEVEAQDTAGEEPPGMFTELTRELSPERAEQLYRKIVPLLVYEILRAVDRSAHVSTVQQIADHLCSREVQERLRACAHVRDGILDELCVELRDHGLRTAMSRRAMLKIMEACGVTGELTALVNCIRLTRAAG